MINNKIQEKPIFGQDGVASLFFISIILVMAVLTTYLLDLTSTSTFGELSYNHLDRAYFMAEAGGKYAQKLVKQDIETDGSYDDTYLLHNETFTLDDAAGDQEGQFELAIDDTDPAQTLVHSTGTINIGISSPVEVKLTYSMPKTSLSIFESVLFAGNELELKKDVTIDGDIATNDSSVKKASNVTITGDEETDVSRPLDPVIFSCATCDDDKEISSSETWFEGIYEYSKLTLQNSTTLTVSGDVILYVKEEFIAEKESTIKILLDSSLTIYVDKKIEFKKEFSIEFSPQPDRPKDFVIYGCENADTVNIEKDSTIIGAIYAPNADIDIQKAQNITGAIVGDKITVNKEAIIIFDDQVLEIISPVDSTLVLGEPKQYFSS